MDQLTALFEFLQHIWFPQPSHFAFVWFVAGNFWLEYEFIYDSIFVDSMVAILDFRSCEFECILSAQMNRSHSRTWNYTPRSTSWAQWYRSCPCLSFWPFLVVAIMDFMSCELCVHFSVHKWIDHTQKHGIRHQDHPFELKYTMVILVLDLGSLGWRPYWIPGHVISECILSTRVNRSYSKTWN